MLVFFLFSVCICGPFLLYHVRACCRAHTPYGSIASTAHTTAQTARTKLQNKYVLIRAQQRKQADRVGEGQQVAFPPLIWLSTGLFFCKLNLAELDV